MASSSSPSLPLQALIPYSEIEFNFEDCSPLATNMNGVRGLDKLPFGLARQGRINDTTLVLVKSIFKSDKHNVDLESLLPLFQAEQEKLKQVKHERLASFYGFTLYDIVSSLQEYPTMGNLEAYILLNPSLVWPSRHQIALDIAVGMEYLHQRRHKTSTGEKTEILHMDLRSENILLIFDVEEVKVRAKVSNIGFSGKKKYLKT
jgi:serine/threonine protein kinase